MGGAPWMVAASLLFACMGVCVKLAAPYFGAGELVFYRGFVAMLVVAVVVVFQRVPLATKHVRAHLWRGTAGFVSLAAYFYAITLIPLATAVTLAYTSPLFLALILAFWAREGMSARLYAALAVGFAGVVLVLQPSIDQRQWLGGLCGLASGIVSSIAYFNVRRLGELGEPEWRTVFYFSAFSSVAALPWVIATGPFHPAPLSAWLLVLGLGGFGAAAQWCMTTAYARGRTLSTAGLAYTTVVFSSLFGVLVWQETLSAAAWLGIALIVAAGIAASLSRTERRPLAAEL